VHSLRRRILWVDWRSRVETETKRLQENERFLETGGLGTPLDEQGASPSEKGTRKVSVKYDRRRIYVYYEQAFTLPRVA
jgi:hypothetical protein